MFDDRNRPISQNEYADRSVLGKPTSITNKHDKL
jgi:hypothetical protein